MMPERDIAFVRKDPETPKTQLVIVVGLLVVAAIIQSETPVYIALVVGLISLIFKSAGDWIVWGWYKLAELLSRVVNPIVLGVLYFIFITPIALLFRTFGNDPLSLKRPKGSLWEVRDKKFGKEDLTKPF